MISILQKKMSSKMNAKNIIIVEDEEELNNSVLPKKTKKVKPILVLVPEIKILDSKRKGECGNSCGMLYIPRFRGGCCGDDNAVIPIPYPEMYLPMPTKMDKKWFAEIAEYLKQYPFDWSWSSFKANVILPNRKHIQAVNNLNDFFTDRVCDYLYVVLNNWEGYGEEKEAEAIECDCLEYCISHRTFFTVENLEF
jgi:hypothetical protein